MQVQVKGFNAKPDISILSNFQDKLSKLSRLWRFVLKPNFEMYFDWNYFVLICIILPAVAGQGEGEFSAEERTRV